MLSQILTDSVWTIRPDTRSAQPGLLSMAAFKFRIDKLPLAYNKSYLPDGIHTLFGKSQRHFHRSVGGYGKEAEASPAGRSHIYGSMATVEAFMENGEGGSFTGGSSGAEAQEPESQVELLTIRCIFSVVSTLGENSPKWEGKALEALTLLESCDRPLFITGKAGTGKSTLLRHFTAKNRDKNMAVLAPTGVAALNARGQTIHSFFRFPHHPFHPSQIKKVSKAKRKLYENLEMIIIDEISMVRADMMDNIDAFLRKNGPSSGKPFGGVRMVFFGDLFQLPPVIAHEIEEQLMSLLYDSPYFFSAYVLQKTGLKTLNLEKIYRQKDPVFMDLLNAVRHKELRPGQLEMLNARYIPDFRIPEDAFYITLTATNRRAATINERHLAALVGKECLYEAKRSGTFPDRLSPNEEVLKLKEGTQVMFIRNDPQRRWVNGSIGKVTGLDDDSVLVELVDNGLEYEVEKVEWEMLKYRFDDKKHTIDTDVIGTFSQLPIRPAWAITIHKSQGKTFERVIIDTGSGAFASGQIYVALSRCTSLEGIVLRRRIRAEEIKIDEEVLDFASRQGI